MDDFLKMDVFFLIATLAVVVLTMLTAVFLFYAIRVARMLDRLGTTIQTEVGAIKEDIDDVRLVARREAGELISFIHTAGKAAAHIVAPGRKRRS